MLSLPATFSETLVLPSTGLVYGMPNAVYHRVPAVSQTQLKAFRRSPFHYFARHEQPVPAVFAGDDSTDDMFDGELTHCATLEALAFDSRYVVGPEVKTRAAKAWKDFVDDNPGRVAITSRQYDVAHAQAASLRRLEAVAEILEGGRCEVSAFWNDPVTGLPCRCRPDCANDEFGTVLEPRAMLLDVKKTRDASRHGVQQAIARYGYHHQGEWYERGYAAAAGIVVAGFIFAFVESEYPFAASVYEIDPEAREIAASENRQALDDLARCRREGRWPGYSAEVQTMGLPRWAGGSGEYY